MKPVEDKAGVVRSEACKQTDILSEEEEAQQENAVNLCKHKGKDGGEG